MFKHCAHCERGMDGDHFLPMPGNIVELNLVCQTLIRAKIWSFGAVERGQHGEINPPKVNTHGLSAGAYDAASPSTVQSR